MTAHFDAYFEWLQIAEDHRPPNHYQLLGLPEFEPDADKIYQAVLLRTQTVRRYQLGSRAEDALRLIAELSRASDCLSTPERKAAYDAELRAASATAAVVTAQVRPLVSSSPLVLGRTEGSRNFVTRPAAWAASASLIVAILLSWVFVQSMRSPSQTAVQRVKQGALDDAEPPISAVSAVEQVAASAGQPPAAIEVSPGEASTTPSPEGPLLGRWVDLLQWAEGVDWTPRGLDWNSKLASPITSDSAALKPMHHNRFPLPAILEGDYDLEAEFTRHRGRESVSLFFPVGSHNMHFELGAMTGAVGGVHWIDGQWALKHNPTTHRPFPISNGVRHQIQIRVRRSDDVAEFEIDWDDQPNFIHWQGEYGSLRNVDTSPWRLSMPRHVWIGNWDNRLTFHKVQVRMLSGSIVRDTITDADRAADLTAGLVRLVGQTPQARRVGWDNFLVNQVPQGSCDTAWPMLTENSSLCADYYGAHAPSRLTCPIPARAKSFTVFGCNHASRTTRFIVRIDGQGFANVGPAGNAPIEINLPAGASSLELVVGAGRDNRFDQSYWCYPRFHDVPLAQVTDEMRYGSVAPNLNVVVSSSELGFGSLSRNRPIDTVPEGPIDPRDCQPCREFLFAHAPSTVKYAVPDGMTRFTAIGYCPGTHDVRYEVWADDARIYQSARTGLARIDVSLPAGAKTIDLRVDPLGNATSDWSFWCYPRLHAR